MNAPTVASDASWVSSGPTVPLRIQSAAPLATRGATTSATDEEEMKLRTCPSRTVLY